MSVYNLALDLIDPPRDDDRIERTPAAIAELAASIAAVGLIHPPTVRVARLAEHRADMDGELAGGATAAVALVRYECVAGWTRILALRSLGRATASVCVESLMDDRQAARVRLAENLDREQLSPIEESRRLTRMRAELDLSVEDLAEHVHRSVDWVLQRLALLALPEDLQVHVHLRELALGSALALGRVTDPQHRAYLLKYALEAGATVDTVRAWVSAWQLHHETGSPGEPPAPTMPVLNQPVHVEIPCARCHTAHTLESSCIIRVCQACGREIERELRQPAPTPT
jgi:ParB family transcriptional regulator, chromosome partitioning protein